jgi:homoserine dehydrogenase
LIGYTSGVLLVYDAVIIGFGNVGKELVRRLPRIDELRIRGVLSSRGGVLVRSSSDLTGILDLAQTSERLDKHPSFMRGLTLDDILDKVKSGIAYIAIPPSYETFEPNTEIFLKLLKSGFHVITADKTVLARDFYGVLDLAKSNGVRVGYRATVAAGIPATDVALGLRGRDVRALTAVLNATTNYIITLVEKGLSYDEAVNQAIKERLAEPNPEVDTHGWDPAAKLAILSSIIEGKSVSIHNVRRVPLENVTPQEIREALRAGKRVRYVAKADFTSHEYRVTPASYPSNSPLGRVGGNYNLLEFDVEGEGIVVYGPVGPAWRTAEVMLTDTLDIVKGLS